MQSWPVTARVARTPSTLRAALVIGMISRVVRATLLAAGLTAVFLVPSLLTHFAIGLVAPISSGYMTGRIRRLSGGEAAAVGGILAAVVGLPVPMAQHFWGILPSLSPLAVIFLSSVVAIYYGALVGIAAWYGGHLVRREAAVEHSPH